VKNGFRIIDADSHAMEPEDMWDRYLDKKFAAYTPTHRRLAPDYPWFGELHLLGHTFGFTGQGKGLAGPKFVDTDDGEGTTFFDAAYHYIEQGFSAASYLDYMDEAGIDHMFIYPSFGLLMTGVPNMEPRLAAAIRRAYNDWLYDYCQDGGGRLHGVATVDLRDVDLAVAEATRCVKELGYKTVYVLPDNPTEGIPLDHPYYDDLWAAVAELGVPLGTHEGIHHRTGNVGYVAAKHMVGCSIPFAVNAVTFGFGEQLAALMFTGAICARHPDLQVVFTESSVGWAATWLNFLDEKWENSSRMGYGVADQPPSYYFKRQCYISGEAGERGYDFAVQAGLEDCLMAASDFPHPEDPSFPKMIDKFFDGRHVQLSEHVLRKILWDTPARIYGIE
jgi:predicted TIM-barrel fold metal-dependent hydrolase